MLIVRVACQDCDWILPPDDRPKDLPRFSDPEISNEHCRERARQHSRQTGGHKVKLTILGESKDRE